jgi:hypothetical protein
MRVEFVVSRLHFPKSFLEWQPGGYVIATVTVMSCSDRSIKPASTLKFKGNLPSLAPYVVYSTPIDGLVWTKREANELVMHGSRDGIYAVRTRLTREGLDFLVRQEIPQREGKPALSATAMRVWFQENESRFKAKGQELDDSEIRAVLPSIDLTDYVMLPLYYPLLNTFGHRQANKLRKLSISQLLTLHNRAFQQPFLLALQKFSKKTTGMPPISYGQVMTNMQQGRLPMPADRVIVGVRLIDFMRNKLRLRMGHTIFRLAETLARYLLNNPGDKAVGKDGIQWLISNGELCKPDEEHVALIKDMQCGTSLSNMLAAIFNRDMAPTYRNPPTEVPCIPSVLTKEQRACVEHAHDNFLTIVTGPPGTGT